MKYVDQLNRTIQLPQSPLRIVSIVPSQTELLYYLGLETEVIGITKFCIHPKEWFQTKKRIGGTKNVDIKKIKQLKPDLIIGNKEENTRNDISQLEEICPVWLSDVNTFDDALDMIAKVGDITNTASKATELLSQLENLRSKSQKNQTKKAIYLIWNDPIMAVGKNTFIDSMMTIAGYENCITEERYPEIDISFLQNNNHEVLLLSTEPYPFKNNHLKEFSKLLPNTEVKLVDGELFSWYGSRLLQSFSYFKEINE